MIIKILKTFLKRIYGRESGYAYIPETIKVRAEPITVNLTEFHIEVKISVFSVKMYRYAATDNPCGIRLYPSLINVSSSEKDALTIIR